ncbi:hypothetical protein SAMN05445850_5706 [Paraburkholderia tuberum]|uniref:Uncharacterized protein n=1 Tax=Paraburkholderia tuberum TaxID=157910 RepID=A0A1H1JU37_9BURK|nr:hypothetical protein SAMN05445850_5706 [Paraburkholderia tuberum]
MGSSHRPKNFHIELENVDIDLISGGGLAILAVGIELSKNINTNAVRI